MLCFSKQDLTCWGLRGSDRIDVVSICDGEERLPPTFRLVEYDIARDSVPGPFPELDVLVPLG